MKIFISYGHNDHTALVDALYDALLKEGHAPWKDDRYEGRSGIPAGDDFTRVIYDAIRDSDFVVAFTTRKTLASQFCCDERQYAYNLKGRRFIQLRLDGVEIRLGNSGSYIDMDRVEDGAGCINQRLLQEKLQALYAAFRSPDSLISPSAKFERYLRIQGALQYDEFITMPERDDFVGRKWLREQCKRWVLDDTIACRLFVILGEAGTGKTAFVRHLAEDRELVRSVHVCVFDRPKTRNIKDSLKNLAYTLTQTNPSYCDYLRNRSFEQLEELDYDGLFEFLFIEPLKNETEKYLLIIDGLDELEETTGLNPLIKVLRQYARRLNPNISILMTGRPEENIISKIKTVNSAAAAQSVLLSKDNGRDDLNEFIRRSLIALGCHSEALQQRIFDACDGNFEYLTLLFREATEEGLQLSGDTVLPRGLQERYTQYLDRRMEKHHQDEELTREQYTLLSLLAVAYEPIPLSLLAAVTGYDEYDVSQELKVFGSLIRQVPLPEDDRLISFFSKGFRDYLLGGACAHYRVRAAVGVRAIASYVMKRCTTEEALTKLPYLDKHAFTHLLVCMHKDREAVEEYITRMKAANADRTILRIANALCSGEQEAITAFFSPETDSEDERRVVARLKGQRAAQVLSTAAALYDAQGRHARSLMLQADILRMDPSPQALTEAEALYRQARELYEQAQLTAPGYHSRYDLSVVYERLGNICRDKNTPEGQAEAVEWYNRLLEVDELNYQEHPCYQSRRALSFTYYRLGNVARDRATPEGRAEAEEWYRKALILDEQNFAENPCYESRRSLSGSYDRLGDIAQDRATPEGRAEAEEWYRKSLELNEQNYRENPCYESRRSLSLSYDMLGGIAQDKDTPEGQDEAEEWYRKMLALDEQNYRENPGYASRRSLSIAYERLGNICRDKATPKGTEEALAWFLKALALDEQNYQENPCYESRRTLSVAYDKLGNILQDKETPGSQSEAENWFQKMLALDEQNYRENPGYASRRSLSIAYERLGNICRDKATPQGTEEALAWFQKALELAELNFLANPGYESRRALGVIHFKIGLLCVSQNTPEALVKSLVWFRRALAMDEENLRQNPCEESRRDRQITLNRILRIKSDPMYIMAQQDIIRKDYPLG